MRFKEFDLSDYIIALEDFKNNSTNDAIKLVKAFRHDLVKNAPENN